MKYFPYVRLVARLEESSKLIASAAKATISPKDFDHILEGIDEPKIEEWARELVRRGHGSPLEHSIYVFEIVCSRVCSHQLVRHRHASYSQLSQRYSDKYLRGLLNEIRNTMGRTTGDTDEISLIDEFVKSEPDFQTLLNIVGEAFIVPPRVLEQGDKGFLLALLEGVRHYYSALRAGVSYEDARLLLPQAVKTRIIVSMNARELLEVFLPLRMCSRAQWEIRWIAWMIRDQLMRFDKAVFKYSGPRCILSENRARLEPCTLEDFIEGRCYFTIERCPEMMPRSKIRDCLIQAFEDHRKYLTRLGETSKSLF
ncbi:FAD-dependent thymidylate synthase [Thermogladius sp. 4427co]|uniref:FAD-dependent thymidylate synthase n=1 Tax=Thermogladius sp. 4427co TaxID=3450718 RepID=UPI003F79E52F